MRSTFTFLLLTIYFFKPFIILAESHNQEFVPVPPANVTVVVVPECAFLKWNLPATNPGEPGYVGTKIFKDGVLLDSLNAADTFYCDFALDCGYYEYYLTGIYMDQTGNLIESDTSNHVDIFYFLGPIIPFFEDWNSTNFSYYNWIVERPTPEAIQLVTDPVMTPVCRFSPVIRENGVNMYLKSSAMTLLISGCTEKIIEFDLKCKQTQGDTSPFLFSLAERDSVYQTEEIFPDSDTSWKHYKFYRGAANSPCERLRFEPAGTAGQLTSEWFLDNISVNLRLLPASNLKVSKFSNGNHLTWSAEQCISTPSLLRFLIIRYLGNDSVSSFTTIDTAYSDTISSPEKYCYTVSAFLSDSYYACISDPTPVECSGFSSVTEDEEALFSISPNPNNGAISITTTAKKGIITLTDLTGKNIYSREIIDRTNSTITIDIPQWVTNGLYLIQIKSSDMQPSVRKIILNR